MERDRPLPDSERLLGNLRERLARLPPAHPSSPEYEGFQARRPGAGRASGDWTWAGRPAGERAGPRPEGGGLAGPGGNGGGEQGADGGGLDGAGLDGGGRDGGGLGGGGPDPAGARRDRSRPAGRDPGAGGEPSGPGWPDRLDRLLKGGRGGEPAAGGPAGSRPADGGGVELGALGPAARRGGYRPWFAGAGLPWFTAGEAGAGAGCEAAGSAAAGCGDSPGAAGPGPRQT